MNELKYLIFVAFTFAIGMTSLITSCILDQNWLILSIACFYILCPIPSILPNCCSGEKSDPNSLACDWIYFSTTGFVISSFALPLIWFRMSFISGLALTLIFISDIVVLLSIVGIFMCVLRIDSYNSII